MTRLLRLTLPAVLTACTIESNLTGEKGEPDVFDSGDTGWNGGIDTEDTGGSDSGGIDDSNDAECPDQDFPGRVLSPGEACTGGGEVTPDWSLTEAWSVNTIGYMLSAPVVGQLTDDNGNGKIDDGDTPDVVAAPYGSGVYAFDGATGAELWKYPQNVYENTTPAIGDLDGDGFPEVVVGNLYGSVALHGEDGSLYWTGPGAASTKAYCGQVGIADLEQDGEPEIYFGNEILDGQSGVKRAAGSYGQGSGISGESPMSIAVDLDDDGWLEVVVGNAAYDVDGAAVAHGSGQDGFVAAADLDGDGKGEVVAVRASQATLLEDDFTTAWTVSIGGSYGGPPAIADFDGDGEPEIAIVTNQSALMIEPDGTIVWTKTLSGSSVFYYGVSAYDLDGDGAFEMLVTRDAELDVLRGTDGTTLASIPHDASYQCGQLPTVADVDNDGQVEILFNNGYGSATTGGFMVVEDTAGFVPGLQYWTQHQFNLVNIDDDMTIPVEQDPNWPTYNSMRAGPPADALGSDRNVVAEFRDVCADLCSTGEVTVWFSVGNDGDETIEDPLSVSITGVTDTGEVTLWETTWTKELPPRWMSDAVEVQLTGVPSPLLDLILRVDGGDDAEDGAISECVETDNEMTWGEYVCL